MIECDTCKEWISLWLDARLTESEIQQVEVHTATCPTCRATLNAQRRVDWLLANSPMMSPAPGFTNRFQARLTTRRRRHRTWAGLIILGLTALFMLLGTTVLLAIPGVALWENLSASGLLVQGLGLLLDLGKVWTSLLGLAWLVVSALAQGLRHPVFIAYAVATAILAVTWAQLVRRRGLAHRPLMKDQGRAFLL